MLNSARVIVIHENASDTDSFMRGWKKIYETYRKQRVKRGALWIKQNG
jgi:hypothetical protein